MKILLKKYKYFLILYLGVVVTVLFICIKRIDYSVTTTGDITNISSFMSVENSYEEKGSLNSIFVYSKDNATIFQKLISSYDSEATVEKLNKNYSSFSDDEYIEMGKIQKNQSIECSIISAYKTASKSNSNIKVEYSFLGIIVNYYIKDNNKFRLGDIIVKIDDVDISNEEAFVDAYSKIISGAKVKVQRGDNLIDIEIDEYSTYKTIGAYRKYKIDYEKTTPRVTVGKTNTLGPSAGLLQALSLYNKLVSDDITKGQVICGTGTISSTGVVGAIGGIEQKIIAAFKNNCKIFLCPSENYEEGLKRYNKLRSKEKMRFVSISTLDEALEVLRNA